jgi:hypothetical protein
MILRSTNIGQALRRKQRGFLLPPGCLRPSLGVPADPPFANVKLLLHMDGADGSTTFTDSSGAARTVTAVGNAQISTAQSKWGGASGLFDGSGDYLTVASSTDFDFGTGDFTVEMWIRTTQTNSFAALLCREWGSSPFTGGWSIFLNNASQRMEVWCADFNSGAPMLSASTGGHNDGNWHHVAWCRSGNSHRLFLDGISVASVTSSVSLATVTKNLTIGNDLTFGAGARAYNGYIDDLRITKGTALYTSAFAVPTAPFPNS